LCFPDDKNQTFQRHYDGCYPRNNWDMSILTFIVYLTDDFEGGHTTFFPYGSRQSVAVKPVRGMACVFQHGESPLSPEHEGSVVHGGRKYVLRSDVMYRADRLQKKSATKGAKEKRADRFYLYE
jgi:hypothetical protein